jgi:hypothetical protein
MLPSLCLAMAAIPYVSRISVGTEGRPPVRWPGYTPHKMTGFAIGRATRAAARSDRQRLILGFHAASWQHRYLDCGTLFLSGRCGRGTPCRGRRQVVARKEPPMAGACMVGEVLG